MPALLEERSQSTRVLLVVIAPLAFGALVGVMLGVSAAAYLLLSLLAAVGAFAAGLEHVGAVPGGRRGVIAGILYGAALLIAHDLTGEEELVELSDPPIVLIALTAGIGALLGAIGGSLRARREIGDELEAPSE